MQIKLLLTLTGVGLLSACQLIGSGNAQPPLPTIVQTIPTTTPTSSQSSPTPAQVSDGGTLETTPIPTPAQVSDGDTLETTPIPTLPPTATSESQATDTPIPPPPPTTEEPLDLPPLDSLTPRLIPIAGGFNKPLFLTHAGDGSDRLFVVEQAGRIMVVKDGQVESTPFLDIISIVGSDANEQGLLSMAFHPDYVVADNAVAGNAVTGNGLFFVNYTNRDGNTTIARYQVSKNPNIANPDSGKILLTIGQPYGNHNGGQLAFGPDGYLYIGMGDGGAANDPHDNGQNLNALLGKILRLDVDNADPYGVPQDNPFVNTNNARPEIWSYGWRNPWRFSFDPATGDMYIADVGQNQYEEVHVEPAGTPGGQNYGWRLMEGQHCFDPATCDPASLAVALPIAEYDHSQGCSITGGYVYRGSEFPTLTGVYFYGDYCSGLVWGLRQQADGSWTQTQLLQTGQNISSFGQDEGGEVYVVNHQGNISQIGR